MAKKYFITKDGKRLLTRYGRDGFVTLDTALLYSGSLFVTEQSDLTAIAIKLYQDYYGETSNPSDSTLMTIKVQLQNDFVEMDYAPIAEKRLNNAMIRQYRNAQYQTIMQASALISNIVVYDDDDILDSYVASLEKAMNSLHRQLNARKKTNK